jgi:hypothetical protein
MVPMSSVTTTATSPFRFVLHTKIRSYSISHCSAIKTIIFRHVPQDFDHTPPPQIYGQDTLSRADKVHVEAVFKVDHALVLARLFANLETELIPAVQQHVECLEALSAGSHGS